jgi:Fe-S-cluster containining protein
MQYSPKEIWEMYDRWKAETSGYRVLVSDIHIVAPMLSYLGESLYDCDGLTLEEPKHFYTCKHFDSTTGNCGIYEHRPLMCRDYPYGNTCRYLDCTMRDPSNAREDYDRRRALINLENQLSGVKAPAAQDFGMLAAELASTLGSKLKNSKIGAEDLSRVSMEEAFKEAVSRRSEDDEDAVGC